MSMNLFNLAIYGKQNEILTNHTGSWLPATDLSLTWLFSLFYLSFFFSHPTISCWCALLIWRRQLFSFSIQSVRHWYFVVDFIMEFFLLKYIVSIFAKIPWFVRSFASVWFSMFHYGIFALILFRLVSVVDVVSIHKILPSH